MRGDLEEENGLKESLILKLSEKIFNWKRLNYLLLKSLHYFLPIVRNGNSKEIYLCRHITEFYTSEL